LRGGVEQLEHVLGVVVELVGDLGVELQELREAARGRGDGVRVWRGERTAAGGEEDEDSLDDEGEMELAVGVGEEDAAEVVGVEAVEETVEATLELVEVVDGELLRRRRHLGGDLGGKGRRKSWPRRGDKAVTTADGTD
jgi:hypothetical protein